MQKMTLEKLAEMMQKEFLSMRTELNASFTGLEERMDRLELRMDRLEQRMDALELRVDHIELEIDLVWGELKGMKDRLATVDCRPGVATLKIRVERIEKRLKTKPA